MTPKKPTQHPTVTARRDWSRGPRPGEKRKASVKIHLTDAERTALEQAATAAEQTISDFTRQAVEERIARAG